MSWKILLGLIILYFLILGLGGLAFHYFERVEEEPDNKNKVQQAKDKIKDYLMLYQCPDEQELELIIREVLQLYDRDNFTLSNNSASGGLKWDIPNSMFFAATLATTIGYGNMAPVTQIGRAFCVFYAFISIPAFLVMLGGVGHTITQLFNKLDKKMDRCKNPKAEKITKSLRSLATLVIGMGLFMFLPAGAFMYMEDWSYPDSLYYVFISLTTVGLGDLVPGTGAGNYDNGETKTSYQLSVALWIIFGLAWLSTVIAMVQDFVQSLVDKMDTVVLDQMKLPNLQEKFGLPSVGSRRKGSTEPSDDSTTDADTKPDARENTKVDPENNPGSIAKVDPGSDSVEDITEKSESAEDHKNSDERPVIKSPRNALNESSLNEPPTAIVNDDKLTEENEEGKKKPKSEDQKKDKPKSEDQKKDKPKSEDQKKDKPKSEDKKKDKPKSEDKKKAKPKKRNNKVEGYNPNGNIP